MSSSLEYLKSLDLETEEQEKKDNRSTFEKANETFKSTVKATIGDNYAGELVGNIPQSGVQFVKDITAPFFSPIDTVTTIGQLGAGLIQLAIPGEQGNEELARAVGSYYADRYGGIDNVLKTLKEDPVGIVSDVALMATGVGAGVKATGQASKIKKVADVGETIKKTGIGIDPATPIFSGTVSGMSKLNTALDNTQTGSKAKEFIKSIPSEVLGKMTGTGAEVSQLSYEAGRKGGESQKRLRKNRMGLVDETEVVDEAIETLNKQQKAISDDFTSAKGVGNESGTLKLDEIGMDMKDPLKALDDFAIDKSYRGMTELSPEATAKIDEIRKIIKEFGKPGRGMNTAKGMDLLKRRINSLYQRNPATNDVNVPVVHMTRKINELIEKKVPGYAKVNRDFAQTQNLINDTKAVLGGKRNFMNNVPGAKAKVLKKMQQAMRNKTNVDMGENLKAVERINPNLKYSLAGQASQTFAPRGLAGLGFSGLGLGAGYGALGPTGIPLALLSSPRLVSAGAEGLGSAMRRTEGFRRGVANQFPNALRVNRPITQSDPQGIVDQQKQNETYKEAMNDLLNQLDRLQNVR